MVVVVLAVKEVVSADEVNCVLLGGVTLLTFIVFPHSLIPCRSRMA